MKVVCSCWDRRAVSKPMGSLRQINGQEIGQLRELIKLKPAEYRTGLLMLGGVRTIGQRSRSIDMGWSTS